MSVSTLPPMRVPTLTEVVEWSPLTLAEPPRPQAAPDVDRLPVLLEAVLPQDWPQAEAEAAATADAEPEAVAAPAPIDEALLTQRILSDLQRQVDQVLEARLQAVLAPMLERLTQVLAQQARGELALTLRDVVAEAVSHELARHQGSPDRVESG